MSVHVMAKNKAASLSFFFDLPKMVSYIIESSFSQEIPCYFQRQFCYRVSVVSIPGISHIRLLLVPFQAVKITDSASVHMI